MKKEEQRQEPAISIQQKPEAMSTTSLGRKPCKKHLIIAVDVTAQMDLYWPTIFSLYLEDIIRHFCGQYDSTGRTFAEGFKLSLVRYKSYQPHPEEFVPHDSRTTETVDEFLQLLSDISFSGDGFDDLAIAEGLADCLNTIIPLPYGSRAQQRLLGSRHCILVAASNPIPGPIRVWVPKIHVLQGGGIPVGALDEFLVIDSKKVAELFTPCGVSLSVISPRQLPILREIYNSANSNLQGEHSFADESNPEFLILISKNFPEAHAALCEYEVTSTPSTQNPV